jgi:hypothetical protein
MDLTSDLAEHLRRSGYKAVFLAEGRANSLWTHTAPIDRVSIQASDDSAFFSEIEILPRLRTIRTMLSNSDSWKQRKGPAVCSNV